MLRPMPAFGPWITPSGLPRNTQGRAGDENHSGPGRRRSGDEGSAGCSFDEDAFLVAPDVLLAMDEVSSLSAP